MSLPEKDGWYWFKGKIRTFDYSGLVNLYFAAWRDERSMDVLGWAGIFEADDAEGEWWGPLTPPWEREEDVSPD